LSASQRILRRLGLFPSGGIADIPLWYPVALKFRRIENDD